MNEGSWIFIWTYKAYIMEVDLNNHVEFKQNIQSNQMDETRWHYIQFFIFIYKR